MESQSAIRASFDLATGLDPCASSLLNQAATALRGAHDKLEDDQTKAEINIILLNLPRYIRKAAREELAQRDREDGI